MAARFPAEPAEQEFLMRATQSEPILGKAMQKRFFSEKGGGNSVNERFGKDFYRKGNSVKRSGPFSEPPDSEN